MSFTPEQVAAQVLKNEEIEYEGSAIEAFADEYGTDDMNQVLDLVITAHEELQTAELEATK